MANKFRDLAARTMSSERIKRNEEQIKVTLLEMNLQELRQHCTELTKSNVAELLHV